MSHNSFPFWLMSELSQRMDTVQYTILYIGVYLVLLVCSCGVFLSFNIMSSDKTLLQIISWRTQGLNISEIWIFLPFCLGPVWSQAERSWLCGFTACCLLIAHCLSHWLGSLFPWIREMEENAEQFFKGIFQAKIRLSKGHQNLTIVITVNLNRASEVYSGRMGATYYQRQHSQ